MATAIVVLGFVAVAEAVAIWLLVKLQIVQQDAHRDLLNRLMANDWEGYVAGKTRMDRTAGDVAMNRAKAEVLLREMGSPVDPGPYVGE